MAWGASAVGELRPGVSSDANGGYFDSTISGAGTDYTQQTSPQLSVADGVTNSSTTITSVTGGFTSAMIGNSIHVDSDGQRYFITGRTNTNTITVDRATSDTGTARGLRVGGALNTLDEVYVNGTAGTRCALGSNIVWCKGGTISEANSLSPAGGTSGLMSLLIGYNLVRGDLDNVTNFSNFPTINVNNANINLFNTNAYFGLINFILTGGTGGTKGVRGFLTSGDDNLIRNCKLSGFTNDGIYLQTTRNTVERCWVTGMLAGSTSGINFVAGANACMATIVSGNPCPGIVMPSTQNKLLGCVIANQTGASSDGILASGSIDLFAMFCHFYGNGRDGIRGGSAGDFDGANIRNNIFAKNAGVGINSVTTDYSKNAYECNVNYNAYWANGTARTHLPVGTGDVTLTNDPYLWAAGLNFGLNNVAGGGGLLRANGFPPNVSGTPTLSYFDIGFQHPDPRIIRGRIGDRS